MKSILLLLFVFISVPVFAFQSIVILPFSNESKTQQIYWLGEGFAESLSEEMLLKNAYVLQRPERKAAFDELRLPYVGHVSRATMLKIGRNLGADYIVFGTYNLEQKNLKVEARVIRTSSSKLSTPIQAAGSLDQLYHVQTALKKGLKGYFSAEKLEASESRADVSSVPLHAYELYIKGLLEASDSEKVKFFQRAIEAHPGYSQAIYRLGLALFRLGRFKESNEALAKIQGDGVFRVRVDFLSGLNFYLLRDPGGAVQKWFDLSKKTPTSEIYNNIGISLVAKNELEDAAWYLSKAVELDPEEPDFRFNLAISKFQKEVNEDAARHFRESVELRPTDYQALYWLAKTLERQRAPESKQLMVLFQERLPGEQKGKFPAQFPDIRQLLRPSLSYLAKEEKDYALLTRTKLIKQRNEYVKTYQDSARKQLEGNPAAAILEIKKGITFSPFDWYFYYLWGRALVIQDNRPEAVPQLQFSLWCTNNIDSHILLAELYRDSEQYPAAKKHVQQILALDPKHKKAIEIWSKIHNKN
ncbi:tetratricopeptide repeat protein [bacterium]|nr:tetratricopeptide repeat protein [bacterium]